MRSPAGAESSAAEASAPAVNRYLFITAEFSGHRFPEPPAPDRMEFEGQAEDDLSDEDRTNRSRHAAHNA